MKITFLTSNEHKLNEARAMLNNIEGKAVDLVEIQSMDPKEIISAKLDAAIDQGIEGVLLVDDVGFLIGETGLPGPMVKYFLKTIGADGLWTFGQAFDAKNARVVCSVGLFIDGKKVFFSGEIEGEIVAPQGSKEFGFDCVFLPNGCSKTYGEMSDDEKNSVSHRAIALKKVKEFLEKLRE